MIRSTTVKDQAGKVVKEMDYRPGARSCFLTPEIVKTLVIDSHSPVSALRLQRRG
jgi:hypothetical protein